MSRPHSEKRRYPRKEAEYPVLLELAGDDSEGIFSKTRVVGLGGCMVTNPRPLGFRSLVKLSIAFNGRIVSADGRVAYELPSDANEFEVGIEFLRLAPDDRRHLARLFPGVQLN